MKVNVFKKKIDYYNTSACLVCKFKIYENHSNMTEIKFFKFITLDPKGGELWLINLNSFEKKMEE